MNTSGVKLKKQKIAAFQKIHGDFNEIMKKERCRTCSCFYSDVLSPVYEKIRRFQEINSEMTVGSRTSSRARMRRRSALPWSTCNLSPESTMRPTWAENWLGLRPVCCQTLHMSKTKHKVRSIARLIPHNRLYSFNSKIESDPQVEI